jgi:hypothetical protein
MVSRVPGIAAFLAAGGAALADAVHSALWHINQRSVSHIASGERGRSIRWNAGGVNGWKTPVSETRRLQGDARIQTDHSGGSETP